MPFKNLFEDFLFGPGRWRGYPVRKRRYPYIVININKLHSCKFFYRFNKYNTSVIF